MIDDTKFPISELHLAIPWLNEVSNMGSQLS